MEMSGKQISARREDILVVLATGLFAAGLCFIAPTVLQSLDYVAMWKPSFHFLADAMREGRVPLWNPYMHLGRPYLADMSNMAFYPPVYLICLGEKAGLFLLVWLHCLLAVFGMRKLAGALEVGRWQSYFMAFSFLASGALTARWMTGQLPNCFAICYVPLLFYCAVRTEEPWRTRRVALQAVLLALQLLCHPQVFWFSAIGQAVFILTRALSLPVREAARDAWHGIWQFGVACVWCAGLIAVTLMPFLELIRESNRSVASPSFANSYNLACADLGYLFSPLQSGAGWESNLFVGTIVVISGLAGLRYVRERNVRGLLGVLVVALLIAFGDKTPLFGLIYKWLPGYADFRIHSRTALLVVLVLICTSGIWFSRPHPRLRAWWTSIFGVPGQYVIIALVLLQSFDLVQGTWIIKRVITNAANHLAGTPRDDSFQLTLVTELRNAGLLEGLRPPPRVCVPPLLVPANDGMIYRYSNFDANWPLFLQRPWDYLHAVLGIAPNPDKGLLAPQVYNHCPFPYPDVSLSTGFDLRAGRLVLATNPAPRAFLVYAAEVADYGTILKRLADGYDIHQSALLEKPLAEPLPRQNVLTGAPAAIRRFEPNSLLVDVDAKEKVLLVLAEGWYPGWRAEIDGHVYECVPANIWMRAVPVPAGRHQIRVYFHQDYLLAGLLISLTGAGLVLVVLAGSKRRVPHGLAEPDVPKIQTAPSTQGTSNPEQKVPLNAHPGSLPVTWRLPCVLAGGILSVWLVATAEIHRVRFFVVMKTNFDASIECQSAMTSGLQHRTAEAIAHYQEALWLKPDLVAALNDLAWIRAANARAEFRDGPEAVRLAQRACELSKYNVALFVGTLGAAYAEAGRFDEAVTAAQMARQLALAEGQSELAEKNLELIKLFTARQPYHEER